MQAVNNIMLILCDVDQKEAFRCGNEAPSNTAKIAVDLAKLSPEMRNYIAGYLWFVEILGPCFDKDYRNVHALSDPSYQGFLEAIKRGMAQNEIYSHDTVETIIIKQQVEPIEPALAFAPLGLADVHGPDGHAVSVTIIPAKHPKRSSSRKVLTKRVYSAANG